MDEIFELQRQFAEAQKQDTTHRLSDRNVVEIVLKLLDMKKLDIIFTLSGREYLTHKQLENEIKDELLVRGGRVSTAEIQPAINVDITHVEAKAVEVAANDPETTLLGNELITEWYLDSIAEEVNGSLQEAGRMTVGAVATRFGLPVDFIAAALAKRVGMEAGKQIQAEMRGSTMFTDAFVAREAARIRGAFSGVTKPTQIAHVASAYGLDISVVDAELRRLLAQGQLPGTLKGREYTPYTFARFQSRSLVEFFSQNGYLTNKRAQQFGVQKAARRC